MSRSRPARWLAPAAVTVALIGGFLAGSRMSTSTPDDASVDAGFARDMAVHHTQAVLMAAYTESHAPTAEIRRLASAIAHQQQLEIGQMLGWLDSWDLARTTNRAPMGWMSDAHEGHAGHVGHGGTPTAGAMPGMATPTQLDALLNLSGKRLEIRFLQLMIRHHQGGLPMAREGASRASQSYVRDFAGPMVLEQAEEIDRMVALLRSRGGRQLPAPSADHALG